MTPVSPDHSTGPESRHWWRNQIAATGASFIGYTGFTLVMPFLPLYIQELGETDMAAAAAWAGLSLGATPAVTAVVSPFWGRIADRYGRKLMVERSLVSFVVVMSAMAFVTRPWHVFALRAIQGLFAGYGGLTIAMAAESAPKSRLATAIGLVQVSQRLGPAIGPVIGGVLASLVGLRYVFFATAAFYAAAAMVVFVMYQERPRATQAESVAPPAMPMARILDLPNFTVMLGLIFAFQAVDRSLGPILPLYVTTVGVAPGSVALVAGVLVSVWACAAALGHYWGGRLLRRFKADTLIVGGAILSAAGLTAFGLVSGTWVLNASIALFGLGIGVSMTAAYTAAGAVVPDGAHGSAYSLLNGASLAGLALSPMVSGAMGGSRMGMVFTADVVVLAALAALVPLLTRRRDLTASRPSTSRSWPSVGEDR